MSDYFSDFILNYCMECRKRGVITHCQPVVTQEKVILDDKVKLHSIRVDLTAKNGEKGYTMIFERPIMVDNAAALKWDIAKYVECKDFSEKGVNDETEEKRSDR